LDLARLQSYDDRAHIIKALDTAVRIITEGKKKHGTWTHGIEYFRAPGKVGKNLTWRYQNDVETWRKAIMNQQVISKARTDFEKRNLGESFDNYLKKHREMNENWGLSTYINSN
jgi:hypothetical protein